MLAVFASQALALSCGFGFTGTTADYDPHIPNGGELTLFHTHTDDLTVFAVADDGTETVLDVEHAHDFSVVSIDLEPGDYDLADFSGNVLASFTVTDDLDDEAPEATPIHDIDRFHRSTSWGESSGIEVVVRDTLDAVRYEFEISTESDFSGAHRMSALDSRMRIGREVCVSTFPDYDRSERYHVRVRAVDAAGNAGPWSETDGVVRGCSTSPRLAGALAWPLLFMGLRRRRAR